MYLVSSLSFCLCLYRKLGNILVFNYSFDFHPGSLVVVFFLKFNFPQGSNLGPPALQILYCLSHQESPTFPLGCFIWDCLTEEQTFYCLESRWGLNSTTYKHMDRLLNRPVRGLVIAALHK